MLNRFRAFWTKLLTPIARFFLRLGVSPDAITLVGTVGVVAGALVFFPRGQLLVGVLVITAFVFSDLLDGTMARMSGTSSKWGAFLDSTLDRLGDAAVFGGLVLYYVGPGGSDALAALALYCLVMGSVTSYARARAESLGMEAKGGIAERADRLAAILVMTGLSDIFDLPVLIPLTLWVLAAASTVTVLQRVLSVRSQARAAA
ncbi:CDP-alcohol phosphatidyltransferase family protein [Nocardioides sp. WL0053]|jgi:CDP-diacylglycerol--glycerol-3-phosphate 3-phosphatidyltransferase/CDP-diacylglycerol--inositol 3-phosphatidyltransferase|uniref:Phosphatidylinositol phosphate synthase n=1 Tax=Nocardioides jiangsuensis TaxID=2866161 RepID=A0ABS7RMA4_9ACTN|nr:CDP-alcohol phosphatidyltransferase family protein [Nocardioides jiangsuensis]MBY9076185.1 CDP-alcohol phosphatidyltransferase family protein [Nocardioides jiangsuensis]